MLSPFFQSLPILPYTFLAVLTDGQLEDLLESQGHEEILKLPTSGVIACARYHIGEHHKVSLKIINAAQQKNQDVGHENVEIHVHHFSDATTPMQSSIH